MTVAATANETLLCPQACWRYLSLAQAAKTVCDNTAAALLTVSRHFHPSSGSQSTYPDPELCRSRSWWGPGVGRKRKLRTAA